MNKSLLLAAALLSVSGASAQQRVSEQVKQQFTPITEAPQSWFNLPMEHKVAQRATAADYKALAKTQKAAAQVTASYRRPAGAFYYAMNKTYNGYYMPILQVHPFQEFSFLNTTVASATPTYNWDVQLYSRTDKAYEWYTSDAENIALTTIYGECDSVPVLTAKVGDVSDSFTINGYKMGGTSSNPTISNTFPARIVSAATNDEVFSSLEYPMLASAHYYASSTRTGSSYYGWTYYTGAKDADGGTSGCWFGKNYSGYNLVGAAWEKPEHPYVLNKVYGRVGNVSVKSGATVTLTCKVYKLDQLEAYNDTSCVIYSTEDIAKLEDNLVATGTCTIDASTAESQTLLEFPLVEDVEGITMETTPEIDYPILVVISGYDDSNVTSLTFTITTDQEDEGFGELAYIGKATNGTPSAIYGLHNFFKGGTEMHNGMSIFLDTETPFCVYNYTSETGETTFPAAGGSKSVEVYSYKKAEDWYITQTDGSDVPDWLEVSTADGEGDSEGIVTVTVKASAYPSDQQGGRRADLSLGFPGAHLTYVVRQNDQTGIADVVAEGVQAYVNAGNFVVNVKGGVDAGELSVYNVAGKLVKTATLSQGTNVVNAQDLAKGVYVLQFNGNTVKVVK